MLWINISFRRTSLVTTEINKSMYVPLKNREQVRQTSVMIGGELIWI